MASTKNEVPDFETLEGHEIFKPVDTLRPSQRLRLTAKVLPMVDDSEEFTGENMMRPGLTLAIHHSGAPLPEPMRVSAGFLVSGRSGKILIHTLPPRLM